MIFFSVVLFHSTFTSNDTGKDYITYTDYEKDEQGNAIYDEDGYYRVIDEENKEVRYYVCVDDEGNEYYVETIGENGYTEENGYKYLKFDISDIEMLDCTEMVKKYLEENLITDTTSELYGCVKVTETFAKILDMFMTKYTFPNVEYSWVKLCYYFKYVGPVASE